MWLETDCQKGIMSFLYKYIVKNGIQTDCQKEIAIGIVKGFCLSEINMSLFPNSLPQAPIYKEKEIERERDDNIFSDWMWRFTQSVVVSFLLFFMLSILQPSFTNSCDPDQFQLRIVKTSPMKMVGISICGGILFFFLPSFASSIF